MLRKMIKRFARSHMDAIMALIFGLSVGYILGSHG